MNNVRFLVLGAGTRNGPGAPFLVQFFPFETRHLLTSLPGQDQKLHDSAVGRLQLSSCNDNGSELIVGQHAVTAAFPVVRGNSFRRGRVDDSPADAPTKERL